MRALCVMAVLMVAGIVLTVLLVDSDLQPQPSPSPQPQPEPQPTQPQPLLSNQYSACQSSSQCGPDECCLLRHGRFATTSCAPFRKLGEDCRPPSDTPINMTLSFPGGESTSVTNVHESLCPCEAGAICYRGTCITAQ